LQAVSAGEWPCLRSLENCRPACIIWRQPTDQKEVRLSHLVTRPEERQKGLAARLFDYAFGMEIDRRYVGWVNVHNPARRLYERKGFQYSRKQSQQWLREAR
jgi:GNAT superfamily N-acetyltransferase